MNTAYDIKALGEMIIEQAKKDGLPLAEVAAEKLAKSIYLSVITWIETSAGASETKVDDIVVPFLRHIDGLVMPQIEKIDLDGDGK